MKITVIGGGSTYTPELVEGFARRAETLGLTELVLYDVDAERLGVVGGPRGAHSGTHRIRWPPDHLDRP